MFVRFTILFYAIKKLIVKIYYKTCHICVTYCCTYEAQIIHYVFLWYLTSDNKKKMLQDTTTKIKCETKFWPDLVRKSVLLKSIL